MKDDIQNYSDSTFEDIKHINEYGQEFWYARELQIALGYGKWDNFKKVIDKAMEACEGSENTESDHFADVGKTIPMPKGAEKIIQDYQLSRYACQKTFLIRKKASNSCRQNRISPGRNRRDA